MAQEDVLIFKKMTQSRHFFVLHFEPSLLEGERAKSEHNCLSNNLLVLCLTSRRARVKVHT
jgi:hypothetical protein